MPTLEAKTLKAFGFTNLSEHTTTKKERVIKAILDYAKAEAARRAAEEEARNPKPKKDENQNETTNGANGQDENQAEKSNAENGKSVNGEENAISSTGPGLGNGLSNGKGSEKGSKASLTSAEENARNRPVRRKKFRFLPIW